MARYLLPLYWLVCLAATHAPLPSGSGPMVFDKVVHALMYGGLGLLLGWRLLASGQSRIRAVGIGLAVLSLYGAADELTQPYFGRSAELLDWVADVVGASLGLSAILWLARRGRIFSKNS